VTSGGVYDPRVSFPMGRLLRVILPSEEPEAEQGFRALAVEIFDDGVVVRFMRLRDLTAQKPPEEAARVWDGITLTDDVATRYELRGGGASGDEHVAHGLWAYAPTPPPEARTLTATTWQGPVDFDLSDR
jgi:hypothetical protein